MATHDFQVYFYRTATANDLDKTAVKDFFDEIVADGGYVSSAMVLGQTGYFISGLHETEYENEFGGAFSKLRKDNLPKIGNEHGIEKDIELLEGDGLIEKNYFLYDANRNLIIWQQNRNASHIVRFQDYLCDQMPNSTKIVPVVEKDAMQRIMQGDVSLAAFDVSFALPTNPDMIPVDANTQKIYELMTGLNVDSIRIHASANAPGRGADKTIKATAKKMLQAIKAMPGTRIVRAKTRGTDEHIDLIAERLTTEITVKMDGHYPNTDSMFAGLSKAMDNVSEDLEQIFSSDENKLV